MSLSSDHFFFLRESTLLQLEVGIANVWYIPNFQVGSDRKSFSQFKDVLV